MVTKARKRTLANAKRTPAAREGYYCGMRVRDYRNLLMGTVLRAGSRSCKVQWDLVKNYGTFVTQTPNRHLI